MLFDQYLDEASFRSNFVRPLLTKMGFLAIAELDGSQEFGKDFVFAELTPFGFLRHYGVVVKHEKAIRQTSGKLCQTILNQVRQAFSVSFRLPDSSQESRVSSVIVMNSGSITPNAVTWLRSELSKERYGENVHLFDGERLSQLDQLVAFQQRQMLVPRLTGLQSNLSLNLIVWESILKTLPTFREARGSFTQALENYLAAPFLTSYVDTNQIGILLQECRIIDSINQRYLEGVRAPNEIREQDIEQLRSVIAKAIPRAVEIQQSVQKCLIVFRPLALGS